MLRRRLVAIVGLLVLPALCVATARLFPAMLYAVIGPLPTVVGVPLHAGVDQLVTLLAPVRDGLTWIDVESGKRFGKRFSAATIAERTQICDDICYVPRAKPDFQAAARFFDQIRDLTASGFYTTDAGMKDLQYVGNVPLAKFDGPPAEVLRKLGL